MTLTCDHTYDVINNTYELISSAMCVSERSPESRKKARKIRAAKNGEPMADRCHLRPIGGAITDSLWDLFSFKF